MTEVLPGMAGPAPVGGCAVLSGAAALPPSWHDIPHPIGDPDDDDELPGDDDEDDDEDEDEDEDDEDPMQV